MIFRDRRTAAVCGATLAAMIAVEAADMATTAAAGDRVDDEGTSSLFAAAMAVAVTAGVASLLRRDGRPMPRNRPLFVAGIATTWIGLGLNRWARHLLGRNYRPRVTVVDGHDVVTGGPYRLVRHPMYLGASLTCVGVAGALGTPATAAAWMLPPLALVRRILVEERVLSRSLDDRYDDYAERRWRLVPGIW